MRAQAWPCRKPRTIVALVLCAMPPATAAAIAPTPAAIIRRHAIPSETPTPLPPPPTPTPIPCDCDGNNVVSIAELVQGVRLVLSGESADACGGLDNDRDDVLTVSELIVGVRHALYGCATLAVPDAVFDCNVFVGPRDPYTPAVVRQDIDGTLHITIDYDVAGSIDATGHARTDGTLHLEGNSRSLGRVHHFTGTGELQVFDDVYFLQAALTGDSDDPTGIRLSRGMHGTPPTWSGRYDVTLSSDAGDTTLPLTLHAPPNGFSQCDGDAPIGSAPQLRSGPCLVTQYGGFRFTTALLPAAQPTAIVLFGLFDPNDDTSMGHGTWGAVESGATLGTWTAVRHTE
jgi:hypothetical protein